MSWYKTGKIAVMNGSKEITGTGTDFVNNVKTGFALLGPDLSLYEIDLVTSSTSATLVSTYRGANVANSDYGIFQTQGIIAELSSQVAELIATFGPLRTALPDMISYVQQSLDSKNSAVASANSATASATAATVSAAAAQEAQLAAATSAASAGNSATTAQTAATNSATSATNAASSATAAAGAAASIVSGLRRKTLNGNFSINQRNVTGTVVLAAGVYGHDRWKAGAAGCTYTFSTAGADTTLTITAGSLVQVIEGAFVEQAQHVMKWGGTSLGKISGGNYAASPVQLTATPGSNLTVEFGVGTLALVQVEPGVVPTTFERRPMLETTLCRWYYLELSSFYLFRTTATGNFGGGMETQTFAPMRTTPTLSYVFQAGNYNAPLFVIGRDYVFGYFASGSNVGDYGNYTLKLSAEI